MSTYGQLVDEFSEEKVSLVFSNNYAEIANAISIQGLIEVFTEVREEFPELEVFENDDEFFEMLDATKKDIAFKVAFGEYNPTHDYVRLDGYENLESLDEYKYSELLKGSSNDLMKEYLQQVESNQVELTDEVFEATREIAKEYTAI
ncbi:hypothetical protein [Staphylococcus aureus]|uniref:hypothetical protein n=1 Tax=Staphylococcus aureus TaxID=1280 RepID=UPI0004495B27|nr:hypothetical protein [Staphylococcus aureus]EZV56593.1 hypothetical protein V074_02734 [Staphylococcus aureus 2010-60-1240-1]MBZ5280783.1 hypothetical protein [Staphylococcus aureus]HDE3760607.1 hypothetical protein [Staphylococcus aureus]HDE6087118.1 hypothetical protein [Staphylococcus aureus]HDE6300818.1 hypothetical protein [Staphylococcus aureus]